MQFRGGWRVHARMLACLGLVWIMILVGCQKVKEDKPPPETPSAAAQAVVDVAGFTLSAGADSLAADGASSTTLTATLLTSTEKPSSDGIVVTFTTDKGQFTPTGAKTATAKTSQGTGTVAVPFISEKGVIGTATIVANAQGVLTQSRQITLLAAPGPVVPEVVGIDLTPASTSLPADGNSSTTGIAKLITSTRANAPDGIEVTLTTTLGSFKTGTAPLTTATATTEHKASTKGGTGEVAFSFFSVTTPGTATLVARAPGVSNSATITLEAPPPPPPVIIAPEPAVVTLGPARVGAITNEGGRYLWNWSVIVTDINGNAVPAADVALRVQPTRFTAFGKTAEIEGERFITDSGDIFFTEDQNNNGILDSGEDGAIPDCDGNGSISTSEQARQGQACPGRRAFPLNGKLDPGATANSPSRVTTTADGSADFKLNYLQNLACWLEVDVQAVSGKVKFNRREFLAAPADTGCFDSPFIGATQDVVFAVNASPTRLDANGVDKSTITAILRTKSNNPVIGASVTFTTECTGTPTEPCGTITASAVTDSNGRASVNLISDRKNDESIVIAAFGGQETRTRVTFTGVTIDVKADPSSILADGKQISTLTATLLDARGAPIVDQRVTLTTDRGTFSCLPTDKACAIVGGGKQAETRMDVNGVARVSISATPTDIPVGSDIAGGIITALAAGASGTTTVTFTGRQFSVTCVVSSTDRTPISCPSIVVGGGSSTAVMVILKSAAGTGISGQSVLIATTLGIPSATTVVTDANGQALVVLTSGSAVGDARVTATASVGTQTLQASVTVPIISTNIPASIILTASPNTVRVNGSASSLKVLVRDAALNPVANFLVSFSIVAAPGGGEFISPATAVTDPAGTVTSKFTSGSISSAFQGVILQASLPGAPSVAPARTVVTIAGPPATLSLGFGLVNAISDAGARYLWNWSVIVTDINGNAVPEAAITLGTQPTRFVAFGTADTEGNIVDPGDIFFSEDQNTNGILDPGEDGAIPDCNGDGTIDPNELALQGSACPGTFKVPPVCGGLTQPTCIVNRPFNPFPANNKLDPGVSAEVPLSVTTDVNGNADFVVNYLQSVGCWLEVKVEAESGGIKGSLTTVLAAKKDTGCFSSPFIR